ncbi:MAG: sulfatase [bacterium]
MNRASGWVSVARAFVIATSVLAVTRAIYDVALIARREPLADALALFPHAVWGGAAFVALALFPVGLVAAIASRGDRGANETTSPAHAKPRRRGIAPLAILFAIGAALLIALEIWLRLFERVEISPGPPPARALFTGAIAKSAGLFAVLAGVLLAAFGAVARGTGARSPGSRTTAFAVVAALALAGASVPASTLLARRAAKPAMPAARATSSLADPARKPPNILLIVMDTVRADALASYGLPLDATPTIDRVARSGVTYANASATAPWTLPSHASLFTGLYPSEHGAHYGHLHLDDDVTTMAELLSGLGYATIGFSKKTWLSREMGTLQGFDAYRDFRLPEPRERLFAARLRASVRDITRGRPLRHKDAGGAAIASAASAWIREHAEEGAPPFFLFMNLNEAHLPFIPQRPDFLRYARRLPGNAAMATNLDSMLFIAGEVQLGREDLALLASLYVGEIAYVDRQIATVIAALEETAAFDNTIVIITSDHGENIGDHGLMGHVLCVYDTLIKVPLVVRYPARFPANVIDERLVQLTDVLPTIVDIVDPEAAALLPPLSGRSLLSAESRGFAVTEYQRPDSYLERFPERFPNFDTAPYRRDLISLSAGALKLIEGSDGRRELYDLALDPGERADIAPRDTVRVADLSRALANFRTRLGRRADDAAAPALDAETREELRSLGYIQ